MSNSAVVVNHTGFEGHFLNDQSADVYFLCKSDDDDGTSVRVPAHKILLAGRSAVFNTMFYGSLPEKGDIPLPFVTIGAFQMFLRLFYFEHVELSMDVIRQVVDLNQRYLMEDGIKTCTEFLQRNLCGDNFITVYGLAMLYDLTDLKSYCELNAPQHLTAEDIYQYTIDELKSILQIDELYVAFDMMDVCVKWAQFKCKEQGIDVSDLNSIHAQLGDCLDLIDFNSMSHSQIQNAVHNFEPLLSSDAYKSITKVLLLRGSPCDVNVIVWCAKENDIYKRYIAPTETLCVRVNAKMTLKAVGFARLYCENPSDNNKTVHGQLIIRDNSDDHTVLLREKFQSTAIYARRSGPPVHIHRFESSVILGTSKMYELQVQLSIPDKSKMYICAPLNDSGIISYPRTNGTTNIFLHGDSSIASLGMGFEYLDP